jgi:replicative DNA helicase
MDWKSASEIVFGKGMSGEIHPDSVNPTSLYPPYDTALILLRAGKNASDMIVAGVPYSAIEAAMSAAQVADNGDSFQWLKVLEQTASRAVGGKKLRKEADKLERGEEADVGAIMTISAQLEMGYKELVPMSDIDPSQAAWVMTGYKPFDEHFGGVPDASLTVIGASPGVGKTSLMLEVAKSLARTYTDKSVAIFTLEMLMAQITKRMIEIDKTVKKSEMKRILLSEDILGVQEIYAVGARLAAQMSLSAICIDFADQIVAGEQTEAAMGLIYRTLSALAKKLRIPVILLSQLNRETYTGGVPRINHLRYSGLAEAMAGLILLIYNPHNIFVEWKDQQLLPIVGGTGYIIEGKSRYGYLHGGPGAVQVDWDGEAGWGKVSRGWFNLGGG